MPDSSSFLPEDYIQRRIARRTNVICLTLFAVVMAGVVAAWFVTDRQRRDIIAQQQAVNDQFEQAARRLEQLEQLQEQKQQMLRKAKVTAVLIEKLPRSVLLAELINNMPPTLSLLELDLDTKVLRAAPRPQTALERARQNAQAREAAAGPDIRIPDTQVSLGLVGVAPTDVEVAQFISSLGAHEMFDRVNLQFSEQTLIEGAKLRKFRVSLHLNQDVSVAELEPKLVSRDLKQNPMADTIQIDEDGRLILPTATVADVPTGPGQEPQ